MLGTSTTSKILNEKVALDAHMKHDGGQDSGSSWRSRTRNYVLTKAPDAGAVLDLVEAHEDVPAFCIHVQSAMARTHMQERIQQIAQELWGHLNRV